MVSASAKSSLPTAERAALKSASAVLKSARNASISASVPLPAGASSRLVRAADTAVWAEVITPSAKLFWRPFSAVAEDLARSALLLASAICCLAWSKFLKRFSL